MIHIITKPELTRFLWIIIVLIVGIAILWLATFMAKVDKEVEEEQRKRNEPFEDNEKDDTKS